MAGITNKKLAKSYRLKIDGALTITQAMVFHKALKQAVKQANPITIDMNEISTIDLTGIQLLCSAHHTCIRKKRKIALETERLEWLKDTLQIAGLLRVDCPLKENDRCLWINGGKG